MNAIDRACVLHVFRLYFLWINRMSCCLLLWSVQIFRALIQKRTEVLNVLLFFLLLFAFLFCVVFLFLRL